VAHKAGETPVPGYTLTDWLGTGSYGEVWKANGPGGVSCALKFISLDSKSGLKELRAIGLVKRLQHPNLVPVQAIWLKDIDGSFMSEEETATNSDRIGVSGTKILIIAMGLGQKSLAQRLEECVSKGGTGIPERELMRYMEHAADGIDYLNEPVHDIGHGPAAIIHCDIKPANLLIVGGGVQVCDYGVAKALGQDIRKTLAAGTPAYASPELLNNEPGPKTDQYSLAMSYFELRTGKFPFPEQRAILANLTGQHDFSLLQKDEREVIRRALSMQISKRFGTCREMVDELKLAIGSLSGGSRPMSASNPLVSNVGVRNPLPPVPASEVEAAKTAVAKSLPTAEKAPRPGTSLPLETAHFDVAEAKVADTLAPSNVSPFRVDHPSNILPAELKYKLIRLLGRGNFGEVFEAEAPGGFRVAIKRILRSMDHPASHGELESLQAIKTVAHPFLLQTQAFWIFDEQLVIVMELAEGSLHERIEECKKAGEMGVPTKELIPYFEQVAQALDYLHSLNISHRDIKPQNLLYLKGYAKVADFGLARVQRSTQTTIGTLSGTPLFMAPEVWQNHMSLHSDQYSLAATYVMARLGRPVFKVQMIHELAHEHIESKPDLAPLSGPEEQVLLKALAKKPTDRYPNCCAFIRALRQAVFPALPPPAPPPPPVAPRRSRWPFALLAIVVMLAIAVVAITWGKFAKSSQKTVTPVVPERLWKPDGWEPENPEDVVTSLEGKRYYRRLTRPVGGQTMIAIAVVRQKPEDPPSFYMLQDKVTNRAFQAVWDRAAADPESRVVKFRNTFPNRIQELVPEHWRKGARSIELKGKNLGIIDGQADVPVVSVTVPEAELVAEELGGRLPSYPQWSKAVGIGGEKPVSSAGPGPFKLGGDTPDGLSLALDLKNGPWPVASKTPDESVHGIRQLISNGFEWTRDSTVKDQSFKLFEPPENIDPKFYVVGQSWDLKEVMTFEVIANANKNSERWDDKGSAIGFRLVLEPE